MNDVSIVRGPFAPVVVQYQPILTAALSYDVVATLAPSRRGTARIPVTFEQGVVIVGFAPSVRPAEWGSFAASGQDPTPEDILVDWDLFQRNHLTSNESLEPNTGSNETAGFTTLSSIGIDRRLIQKALPALGNAAPQIGFTFRWRGPFGGAAGEAPAPVSIRLTVFADPLCNTKKEEGS